MNTNRSCLRFLTALLMLSMPISCAKIQNKEKKTPPDHVKSGFPSGVIEVNAPAPFEISGVAAIRGGFAVVGDENSRHGRTWPGGKRWKIKPRVQGPESIDVGFGPNGKETWLILGENKRALVELKGPRYVFPRKYREVCGRGLEGLALRRKGLEWEVAVLWEGGNFKPIGNFQGGDCPPRARFALPRVAILRWKPGKGTSGPERTFTLRVPRPQDGERFRAPDLVWDGDDLLVLLSSGNEKNTAFSHTWLQRFNLRGEPVGTPYKLEEVWGAYRNRKNWEALDWTIDGRCLVMGYDTIGGSTLAIFPYPWGGKKKSSPGSCWKHP